MFCALALVALAADTHPFTIRDMLAMDRISDPQVSPDAARVLFTLRTTDVEANKGRTDLWVARADGSDAKQLTSNPAGDMNGRWASDGRSVLFLSTRSGSSQVWRLSMEGGEPTQVTDLPLDVETFEPFADGKRLVLSLDVYPDAPADKVIEETVARDAAKEKNKVKARIYEDLLFRHWDFWEDGKRSHLFVWTIGSGQPVDVTPGFQGDAPTKPFGGSEEYTIAPDGSGIVFTALAATRDAAWKTDVNLYWASSDGKKPVELLTKDNPAIDTAPVFAPDGKKLAFLRMARAGFESDRLRIAVMDWPARTTKVLTEAWDRSPSELVWARDGASLWTSADDLGNTALFRVDAATGAPQRIVAIGSCGSPRPMGDRVAFLMNTLAAPDEIHTCKPDGSDVRAVTKINAAKVAAARTGAYEPFTFPGWNGEEVHAWIVKPIDFDASRKYPVAFLIHGGPQGSFGNHFHYRWNPQAYAGAGFAAVFVDFHGSTGYGQAFTDSITGDWGGKPYEDLMKGLDAALAKYTFLDGSRVAALGASYGGYMVNWIAGQTDRFKCLVSHDGNLDERMAYFDTEELWFPEWEHGGTPWENPAGYTKHNPIDFVKNWKTPMLVIHGAQDFRVVDAQGMSVFTALQRKGVPSKFLHFPDENHWVLKPQNSLLWHETVIEWITRWTSTVAGGSGTSSGR